MLRQPQIDLDQLQILKLEEPYPQSLEGSCGTHGHLTEQTQVYYQCRSDFFEDGEYFRVSKEDYEVLKEMHASDFECKEELM